MWSHCLYKVHAIQTSLKCEMKKVLPLWGVCAVYVCVKWPSSRSSLLRVDALNPEGMAPMADSTSVASICHTRIHTLKKFNYDVDIRICVNVDFVAVTSVRAFLTVAQFDALLLKNRKISIKMAHNWVFILSQTSNTGGGEVRIQTS